MRLSMQFDSGGARARSAERALGLTPFSQPCQAFFARLRSQRPYRLDWRVTATAAPSLCPRLNLPLAANRSGSQGTHHEKRQSNAHAAVVVVQRA